jgi:Na+/H+ antiporter NhaD/arsenite permease-like protein
MLPILAQAHDYCPNPFWVWPFLGILLSIAILPLVRRTHHWWEENRNKLLVALILAAITLLYYGLRGTGVVMHEAKATQQAAPSPAGRQPSITAYEPEAGRGEHDLVEDQAAGGPAQGAKHRTTGAAKTILAVLHHAVLAEYVPFIVLLFSLYVIAGGIVVRGDVRATPTVNTAIIGTGGVLASFIGTTGAAMLLIRFLLKTNSERKRKAHTVIFFIFVVANIGGSLLPIGDPPLFLGYLRGVDFFWTLRLWKYWAFMVGIVLVVYYLWDTWAYRHEAPADLIRDEVERQPMQVAGLINILWLFGVVAAVATLDPAKAFPGTHWHAPPHVREAVQLAMCVLSWLTTAKALRGENQFNFVAIGEVACLFIGIFITMQIPIEILQTKGPELGLARPWHFFWASGILSSFLDNAPTYVVYFETAGTLLPAGMQLMSPVSTASGSIPVPLLIAISCGAVFMGANTYIGNGPNFMVKAIAEQSGVKMPSFFGYMLYSCLILIPLFILLTLLFFRA